MSNITTIADIQNTKANGEVIMAVQGTIKAVYERKNWGEGAKATTVQNIVLADATGEIRCALWGHQDAAAHKGKEFVIHSNKNTRGAGYVGVAVKDKQDQNGNPRRELQISKSATIQFVEVYNKSAAADRPASAPATQAAHAGSPGPSATRPATNGLLTLEKLANFWEHCYVEAEKRQKKFGFSDTIKQACIGSLFIQGAREGMYRDLNEPASYTKIEGGKVAGEITAEVTDTGDTDAPF